MIESCNWKSYDTYTNESCHIWMSHVHRGMSHIIYEWVMSTGEWVMSYMNESCPQGAALAMEGSNTLMSHVTHMHEPRHTCKWVMSTGCSVSNGRQQYTSESCHTYEWVMSHMWMSHVHTGCSVSNGRWLYISPGRYKFSKVCLLLNLLDKFTTELTFKNIYQWLDPRVVPCCHLRCGCVCVCVHVCVRVVPCCHIRCVYVFPFVCRCVYACVRGYVRACVCDSGALFPQCVCVRGCVYVWVCVCV